MSRKQAQMRTTPTSLYLSQAKTSRKVTLDLQVVGPRRVDGRGVLSDFYSLSGHLAAWGGRVAVVA